MYIFPANIPRCRTNVPRNPCDDSVRALARPLADKGRQKAEMRNANGIPFSALSSFTGSRKKIEMRRGERDGGGGGGGGDDDGGRRGGKRELQRARCLYSRRRERRVAPWYWGVLYARTRPLISLILNILWDASGIK